VPLLETVRLTKYYGSFPALVDLNISVEEGEIYGFVGPNGAGKTTSMKIMATLMGASSGDVLIDGESVLQKPARARRLIGYMPDFFGVYDNLKVSEYLDFYADACNVPKAGRRTLADELLTLVNLSDKRECYVDTLSRGMKQRLCLARSLIHDPRLLILDEPASGMDPQARAEMKSILKALKGQGKTILISSHILAELSEICDRFAIISRGQLMAAGSIEEISGALGINPRLCFRFLSETDFENATAILRTHPETGPLTRDGDILEAVFDGTDQSAAAIIRHLSAAGVNIVSAYKTAKSLEQVFLEVVSK